MAWWTAALDLLYPPRCPGCSGATDDPQGFCPACSMQIRPPSSPLCSLCGDPFPGAGPDHLCHRCLTHRPSFGRARACATYAASEAGHGPLKQALQRYKYVPDVSLAPALARLVLAHCPLTLADYDLLVPVPLHLHRLRWRGFNQAQLLGRILARSHRLPLDPFALERTRATRAQVDLNDTARRQNVAGAFSVATPARIRRRRVLLIDDVYTTGATANECSRTLLRAGARHVDVLVLARAVLH